MTQQEFEQWQAVTESSQYQWVEDEPTRLNDRGALYYIGGESGLYMWITKEGRLMMGTYEDAIPHIGEATFSIKAEHQCKDFNEGFEYACRLGGANFLRDLFSNNLVFQGGPGMC